MANNETPSVRAQTKTQEKEMKWQEKKNWETKQRIDVRLNFHNEIKRSEQWDT